jgi:hypothetical protein
VGFAALIPVIVLTILAHLAAAASIRRDVMTVRTA